MARLSAARAAAARPAVALLSRREPKFAAIAAIIGLVGLATAYGIEHALSPKDIDAATLNENVPLSAQDQLQEAEAPQVLEVGESKRATSIEDVHGGARVSPVAPAEDHLSLLKPKDDPIGAVKPIAIKGAPASALPMQELPMQRADRPMEEGARVALALPTKDVPGEAVKSINDAHDEMRLAQGFLKPAPERPVEMRSHGEIMTPAETSDPLSPLISSPEQAKASAPAPSPAKKKTPAASGAAKTDTPAPAAANKLSFAGEGLNTLQAPRKPRTVIEYLSAPQHSPEWIETFIRDFYLKAPALDEDQIHKIYSDPVADYFGTENVSLADIAREKADYYREWPKRHYELVPGSVSVKWSSDKIADVTFLYDFRVSAPKTNKLSAGRGRARLTLDLTGPAGRITREDGEVLDGN